MNTVLKMYTLIKVSSLNTEFSKTKTVLNIFVNYDEILINIVYNTHSFSVIISKTVKTLPRNRHNSTLKTIKTLL